MWYGLLNALGKLARFAPAVAALGLRQAGGRGRSGRRAQPRESRLVDQLSALPSSRLSGAALAAGLETGRGLLTRPGVRVSVEAAVLKMLGLAGDPNQPIERAQECADTIVRILRKQGVVPSRLAVDGVPGSGKSTLARALAEGFDLSWKSLDHEDMNVPRDFSRERVVYEHHRLLRTQDVDAFDAIVYIDEPVAVSRGKVLERSRLEARQGLSAEVLDYDRMKKIGELAFEACDGAPISIPGTDLLVKVRPPGGFRALENIESSLHAAGHDPRNRSKEQMLFMLAYGTPRSGLTAYLLPGAYNNEFFKGLLAGVRRYIGG